MQDNDYNANYSFIQHEPLVPMGHGEYANMPEKPILKPFNRPDKYRGGVANNFDYGIDNVSGIRENRK